MNITGLNFQLRLRQLQALQTNKFLNGKGGAWGKNSNKEEPYGLDKI